MKTPRRKRDSAQAKSRSAAEQELSAPAQALEAHATATAPELSRGVVVLASHCSVKDAAGLKSLLCAAASDAEPVKLDVRGVERIDTACVQLLCAFVRDRAAQGRASEWLEPPPALYEAARLLGVGELLALPAAPDGAGA